MREPELNAEIRDYNFDGIPVPKFSSLEDRKGFVKKVYGILSVQLLITVVFTLMPVLNKGAAIWMRTH
jgi:FtsH-binding integral membrane protein